MRGGDGRVRARHQQSRCALGRTCYTFEGAPCLLPGVWQSGQGRQASARHPVLQAERRRAVVSTGDELGTDRRRMCLGPREPLFLRALRARGLSPRCAASSLQRGRCHRAALRRRKLLRRMRQGHAQVRRRSSVRLVARGGRAGGDRRGRARGEGEASDHQYGCRPPWQEGDWQTAEQAGARVPLRRSSARGRPSRDVLRDQLLHQCVPGPVASRGRGRA
mmetsp:Transcript_9479/g.38961  ORF Transcript_9479/g.38961 Transcript_9479/m.38961 type:complete len:220 (+) Transcript_9479:901-1560(+)